MTDLLPPLIQIFGSPRYDLAACNINIDSIQNWTKYKTKLNLSAKETEKLYKLVKAKLAINAKEIEGKNGISLKFNKKLDDKTFNDLLRFFINDVKMCPKCKTPELCDGSCNACGYTTDDASLNQSKEDAKPKIKLLTKADKQALKEEKERFEKEEKEKKKPKRNKNKEYQELDDTSTEEVPIKSIDSAD